jgi:hypothetical protein
MVDFQMHPTLICESPILDMDAMVMRDTYRQVLEHKTEISQM